MPGPTVPGPTVPGPTVPGPVSEASGSVVGCLRLVGAPRRCVLKGLSGF